jgi:hypothetical protein
MRRVFAQELIGLVDGRLAGTGLVVGEDQVELALLCLLAERKARLEQLVALDRIAEVAGADRLPGIAKYLFRRALGNLLVVVAPAKRLAPASGDQRDGKQDGQQPAAKRDRGGEGHAAGNLRTSGRP